MQAWLQANHLSTPPKHLASRHYLSSDLSAYSFGLGLQAFQASAKLPSFGGYSYVT